MVGLGQWRRRWGERELEIQGEGSASPRVRSGPRLWVPRAVLSLRCSVVWISVPVDPAEG